jgi:hypothetical protein
MASVIDSLETLDLFKNLTILCITKYALFSASIASSFRWIFIKAITGSANDFGEKALGAPFL